MPTINKGKKPASKSVNRAERIKVYNTSRWKKLRLAKLMKDPLCEMCLQKGITTAATQAHHIDSFMNYEDLIRKDKAFNYNNLMSLCTKCHSEIHKNNNGANN